MGQRSVTSAGEGLGLGLGPPFESGGVPGETGGEGGAGPAFRTRSHAPWCVRLRRAPE